MILTVTVSLAHILIGCLVTGIASVSPNKKAMPDLKKADWYRAIPNGTDTGDPNNWKHQDLVLRGLVGGEVKDLVIPRENVSNLEGPACTPAVSQANIVANQWVLTGQAPE